MIPSFNHCINSVFYDIICDRYCLILPSLDTKGELHMDKIEVGEIFSISDEDGQDQEVEVLGAINLEGTEYVAIGFVGDIENEEEEDIDIFFMKVDEDGDFAEIENDEEFEKVSSAFDELLAAEDNIE